MKYLMITDEDENGRSYIETIEGKMIEEAFEEWFLEDYHGAEWDELEFGGTFPMRDTFRKVEVYPVSGDSIKFDYAGFIDKHDTRTAKEKNPEYKEFLRLKNKFGEL